MDSEKTKVTVISSCKRDLITTVDRNFIERVEPFKYVGTMVNDRITNEDHIGKNSVSH